MRSKYYNLTAWKKMREGYLMQHPLCEKCLEQDRVTLATDCHHLNSPFADGLNDAERMGRLLDPHNLQALCQECHGKLHRSMQMDGKKFK